MSLDKAIAHGKAHRQAYRGAARFDPTCRNHGGCPYCESNRLHSSRVQQERVNNSLKEDVE